MEYLENRTFDEIEVGASASLTRTLTEKDIQVFAIMSGDINPAHVDIEYARSEMFHTIIGHGMWTGALISTVLGTQLPGPGTIYLSQSLRFRKPVVLGDTITVTVTAIEKKVEKTRIIFSCEGRNQKDEVVVTGEAEVIAPSKKIRRKKAELPEISLRRASSIFQPYLIRAKELGALRTGVIQPTHEKIIQAVYEAERTGFIIPVLIGNPERIAQAADMAEVDISQYELIPAENSRVAISKAIALARDDACQMLIRGAAIREELIRAIQKPDKGLLRERHLSYAAVLDIPTYPKALILTDTMVNIDPSLEIKLDITQNAIDFALALGIHEPKVAIVAGINTVNYSMRSTIDAAALCKMAERGQIHGGVLDGPLTFDNVISVAAAKALGIHSPVIGDTDIIVMPNVETGTIVLKQLESLTEASNAGLLLGARVPVLMSHISELHLSTVSCALAILIHHYALQERQQKIQGEVDEQGKEI